MEQQSFEGTWEEILRYAPELVGQRVRLTVFTDENLNRQNKATLNQIMKDRVGRVQFEPSNLSTCTKEAFIDVLVEQHRPPELKQ